MPRSKEYKTRQGELILEYMRSQGEGNVTVNDIAEAFQKKQIDVGVTTIYRQLDKLEKEGKVRKYRLKSMNSAAFEYIEAPEECSRHFHMKCEKCGKVIHMHCNEINQLMEHIAMDHHFIVNRVNTVLYGVCETCGDKE